MTAKSDILENLMINHLFGGAACSQPTQWWIALYSSDPGEGITGTAPTPITNRLQINGWTISGNQASNTNAIQASAVPAGQTWTVSNFAIFDAQTGGRPLYYGAFRLSKTLQEGDIFIISANQLVIREN